MRRSTVATVEVCKVADLPPGEAKRVETDPPIAVFNVDGEFFATADTCSHAEASLSDGWLEGDQVECPYHMAKFCVRTGQALTLPATEPVATYAIEIVDDTILVHVS